MCLRNYVIVPCAREYSMIKKEVSLIKQEGNLNLYSLIDLKP